MFHRGDKVIIDKRPSGRELPSPLKGIIVDGPWFIVGQRDRGRSAWKVSISGSDRPNWYLEKQMSRISELEEKVNRTI